MSGGKEEHPDIVDVFYRPFVRPLGNLVITFARAESALLDLVTALLGGKEHDAAFLVSRGNRSEIVAVVEKSALRDFALEELRETLSQFWDAKDERSRLIHDEWWVGFDPTEGARVGTRGFTRKPVEVVWENRELSRSGNLRSALGSIV